ncbi:18710_t:CDS:2, partial [Racocetra persica]
RGNQEKERRCIKCAEFVNINALLYLTDQCNHNNNICLLNENDVKRITSERIFRRYETLVLDFALSQISTFKWCLNPTCGSGQDHYQGDDAPIMICNLCGQKSCIIHELLIETECEKCKEQIRSVLQEERKECIICTESVNIIAFLNITDQCSHDRRICRECVGEYIKHELEDNRKIRISCPEDNCNEILNQKDVKEFASDDVFKRYEKFMLNFALSQIPTFQWCLNPNCGSGQDHYQGENVPIMICDSCGQKSCIVHGHPIDTVLATLRNAETASESYVGQLKKCPKCASRIEKNDG